MDSKTLTKRREELEAARAASVQRRAQLERELGMVHEQIVAQTGAIEVVADLEAQAKREEEAAAPVAQPVNGEEEVE